MAYPCCPDGGFWLVGEGAGRPEWLRLPGGMLWNLGMAVFGKSSRFGERLETARVGRQPPPPAANLPAYRLRSAVPKFRAQDLRAIA